MVDESFLLSGRTYEEMETSCQTFSDSLVHVLSRTPLLRSLRLSATNIYAWNSIPFVHAHGVTVGETLQSALQTTPIFTLGNLREIELDGVEGVAPLLALAPNAETLSVSLPAGFALGVNRDLADALRHVPKLKSLRYTPDTLRLKSTRKAGELSGLGLLGVGETHVEIRGSADLLFSIGDALPALEVLDLQSRWYGESSTYFCSSSEPICPMVS